MKTIPNYPIWLSVFMFLGPFFMVGGLVFRSKNVIWLAQIVGAAMVMFAFFYLSKRLHEQIEEVMSLRLLIDQRDETKRTSPNP
jgi:hypothetical protein